MGKTHWSIRALSLTLAICLLLGTVPAGTFTLPVFAAESSDTAANVEKVRAYAEVLLNSNYSKAETPTQTIKSDDRSQAFTWDTEGKSDDWRYFNGVMLDAFMMLGLDTDSGNALEFLETFMDANITDNGTVTKWHPNEVDSVPPAYAMMYLIGSAADADKYETAAHFVYEELTKQYSYPDCGGNFLHKQTGVNTGTGATGWTEWNIGLDGLYMAQPFLMAYANALQAGTISNAKNVSYNDIYKAVYDRFIWVSENMYDSGSKLYHHGYSVAGTTVNGVSTHLNGQFWGRGIGWYAVGLVEVIDRMPNETYKAKLIEALKKLFDGMLDYQDETTGMWCNVVNEPIDATYTVTDSTSGTTYTYTNKLETSVTSLMSYALLKAYNEGWVSDNMYAQAGLDAFNGIMTKKYVNGTFIDIYMKSGVGTTAEYYCQESYATDEGKGVGGILMAAAEALETEAKLNGGSFEEKYTVGIVSAPADLLIVQGSSALDTSDIVATVVSNQGSVKTVPGNALSYSFNSIAAGQTEVIVSYDGTAIDSFYATVVASSGTASATGTLTIESTETAPTGGTASDSETVTVSANAGTATVCEFAGAIPSEHSDFVSVNTSVSWQNKCSATYGDYSSTNLLKIANAVTVTIDTTGMGEGTITLVFCNKDSCGTTHTNDKISWDGGSTLLLSDYDNRVVSFDVTEGVHTLNRKGGTVNLGIIIFTPKSNEGGTYDVSLTTGSSGKLLNKGEAAVLNAELAATLNGEEASVSGNIVWASSNEAVASVDQSGNLTAVAAGDATITATVTKVTVAGSEKEVSLQVTIPVKVVAPTVYDVTVTVSPNVVSMAVGETKKWMYPAVSISADGASGEISYSSSNTAVAKYEYGSVEPVFAGAATIYTTVNTIYYNNKTYTIDPIVIATPVVVTGTETYTIVSVDTTLDSIQVGGTANVSAIVSNGTHAVDGATVVWSSSDDSIATVNSNGVVTAVSAGTVTITASSPAKAAAATASVEITVTPKATSDEGDTTETTQATEAVTEWNDEWTSGQTDTVTLAGTGTVTFTLSGTVAAGHWGHLDNVRLWNSNGEQIALTNGDFESNENAWTITNWTLTELGYSSQDTTAANNKTYRLDLWLSNDADTPASAAITASVPAGTYYFTYEIMGNSGLTASISKTEDHTHSYTGVVTAPTCTAQGYTTYTCSCGDSYVGDYVNATGHSYTSVVTAPTCTAQGYTTHTCSNCGNSYKDTYVAASGHSYVDGVCSACGVTEAGDTVYYLDTDGVDAGKEYVIVAYVDGKYYALGNTGANQKASALEVTVSGDTVTLSASDALIAEWLFTLASSDTLEIDSYTHNLYAISNSDSTVGNAWISDSGIRLKGSEGQVYVAHLGDGRYHIRVAEASDGFRSLQYDGETWERVNYVSISDLPENAKLYLFKQEPWVDCSAGFRTDSSEDFAISEATQSWTFTTETDPDAVNSWDTPLAEIWVDGVLYAIVRSDGYAWYNNGGEIYEYNYTQNDPADAAAWLQTNKDGTDAKVTAQVVNGSIVLAISNTGVTNTYSIPYTGSDVTVRFSGENCILDNCQTTTEHLDITDAVEAAESVTVTSAVPAQTQISISTEDVTDTTITREAIDKALGGTGDSANPHQLAVTLTYSDGNTGTAYVTAWAGIHYVYGTSSNGDYLVVTLVDPRTGDTCHTSISVDFYTPGVSMTVPDVAVFEDLTASIAPEVVYNGETLEAGSYDVSYTVNSGADLFTRDGATVTGVTAGVASVTATLNSVTTSSGTVSVTGVTCDFKIRVYPNWENRTTNQVTAEAGDKISFVFSGARPLNANFYMNNLYLWNTANTETAVGGDYVDNSKSLWRDSNFRIDDWNGFAGLTVDGVTLTKDTGDIWIDYGIRLARQYDSMYMAYDVIATEDGTYYFNYDLLASTSGDVFGTLDGEAVVIKPVSMEPSVITVPAGTKAIDSETIAAFFEANGMTVNYADGTSMTVYDGLTLGSSGTIKYYNGQPYVDCYWNGIQTPIWVQFELSASGSAYIHNATEHSLSSDFYTIAENDGKDSQIANAKYGTFSYDDDNNEETDAIELSKAIKMQKTTEISFTTLGAGRLIILAASTYENGSAITVSDETASTTTEKMAEPKTLYEYEFDLAANTTYTISRSGSESGIYYIAYIPEEEVGSYITVAQPDNLVIGGEEGEDTAQLVPTVVYESVQLAAVNYKLQWSSSDPSVVSVDANGVVTAHKTGGVTVTATVTEVNGVALAEEDYLTCEVPVIVEGPALNIQESMHLYSGASAAYSTGETQKSVQVDGVDAESYVIQWRSSNEAVATVDSNGVVTAVAPGGATITATLTSINGTALDAGQYVTDTMTVTVEAKSVEEAYLNSYEYIAVKGWTDNDVKKELQHMVLTIKYNTGEVETVQYDVDDSANGTFAELNNLHVDVENDLDTSSATIQVVDVKYTDGNGNVLFEDVIWIHVEEYALTDFDGTVTIEEGVTYHLDTDGVIDPNLEYVIVPGSDTTIALTNPNLSGNSAATTQKVTINGTQLYMDMNTAEMAEWLFDYLVEGGNVDQYHVSNFAHYLGNSSTGQILHVGVHPIYLQAVTDGKDGQYYIILGYENGQALYLTYTDGTWTRTTTPSPVYLYQKVVENTYDQGVDFTITDPAGTTADDSYNVPLGRDKEIGVLVEVNHVEKTKYTIEWFSSDESVATVDENGVVTPVGTGDVVITARLTQVEHNEVICNEHDTPYIERTIYLNVTSEEPTGTLLVEDDDPTTAPSNVLEVGIHSDPNFSKVYLDMVFSESSDFNYTVESSDLLFYLADAYKITSATDTTPVKDSEGNTISFDSSELGYYLVKVRHGDEYYDLILNVVEDPYAGLEEATDYPGYPDAGAVRIDKIASGANGIDFNDSGVANVQLEIAGVSTRSPVDVVLIVDVSNSMAWTDSWFNYDYYAQNGYTIPSSFTAYLATYLEVNEYEEATDEITAAAWEAWVTGVNIKDSDNETLANGFAAEDAFKIPANGEADKLDNAMEAAKTFADILLNVEGGSNTLSFVTFAGHDGTLSTDVDNKYMDSVRTPFVAVTDYTTAETVFNATKFTQLDITTEEDSNDTSTTFYLDIGGHESGDPAISGLAFDPGRANRGNTNYDYAFGEAIDAVEAIWETYGGKEAYDETGRQVHVVFMTDGAPSHYNGEKLNGGNADKTWDQSAEYEYHATLTADAWLTFIKNPNTLATELRDMIYGAYTVGFDLAHGGFGAYSWNEDSMERVLEGLAENAIVPVTMASNADQLSEFYRSLAETLAYAGTSAKVTDVIGSDFTLYTGPQLYASASDDGASDDFEYVADSVKNSISTEISIKSCRLVLASDIGSWLSVINTDGTVTTVQITEEHLGLRVNETPITIETVTLSKNGTVATSSLIGEGTNILTTSDGNVTITAKTFTYTNVGGLEKFEWNLGAIAANGSPDGNITEREIVLSYNAYLKGSFDNPQDATAGIYNTNQYAYLEYVDANGKYAKQNFGMPTVAWKEALVTVRFYLVNEQGQYVNYANVAFSNPANRIFLEERASYSVPLNDNITITAQQAAEAIKLSSQYELYDRQAYVTVYNAPSTQGVYVEKTFVSESTVDPIKRASSELIDGIDVLGNGSYVQTVIEIPVILHDLGESARSMEKEIVVIDYGKSLPIDAFNATESLYAKGYADERDGTEYWYTMEIAGFAPYSASHDPKDYVPESAFTKISYDQVFEVENGTFTVGEDNQIIFTPNMMLEGSQKVFIAVKFAEYQVDKVTPTSHFFYMFKEVIVVPATVMYYETEGNVKNEFTLVDATDGWDQKLDSAEEKENRDSQEDPYDTLQDEGPEGAGVLGTEQKYAYGYDTSYSEDNYLSDGSSWYVEGTTTASQVVGNDPATYATFTFAGTGFDLISRTGRQQATLRVHIYQGTEISGDPYKIISVIDKGANELYQIPVISVKDMPHGTYTVQIIVYESYDASALPEGLKEQLSRGNEFYFDAVRIYDPVAPETVVTQDAMDQDITVDKVYSEDGENTPQIIQIGKLLIDLKTYESIGGGEGNGAVYMDALTLKDNADWVITDLVQDYQNVGPNNEVYLNQNQGIAFILNIGETVPASIQIGAKSIDGTVPTLTAEIRSVNEDPKVPVAMITQEVTTSTAMYYKVSSGEALKNLFGTNKQIYVIIWNTSEAILSVTDIKIAYAEEKPDVPAAVSTDSKLVENAGDALLVGSNQLKKIDDIWYYCNGSGEILTSYTGLVPTADAGTWYVENGKVDFSYSGLVIDEIGSYYVASGCVDTSLSGLAKRADRWLYFVNGRVDTAFTGMAEYGETKWYVVNGEIDFTYSGMDNTGKYYILFGQLASGYTGLVQHGEELLYVIDGQFAETYSGSITSGGVTYNIQAGKVVS